MTKKSNNLVAKLSDRQRKAIPHFLQGGEVAECCRAAGISRPTFYAWLENEDFRAALECLQIEAVNYAAQTMRLHFSRATDTLIGLLDTPLSTGMRRNICNDIINHAIRLSELRLEKRCETTSSNG